MKFAFVLGVHNRIRELYCHLDILKYCKVPHEIIVPYSGRKELPDVPNVVRMKPGRGGVVIALLRGMEEARKRGIDYICYRNADDWLFKHEIVEQRLKTLEENPNYSMTGYTWYADNLFSDLALNELYLKMGKFSHVDTDKWEMEIRKRADVSVEHVVAEVLRPTEENLYRLRDRESASGIGYQTHGDLVRSNNRWIHRPWQLITAHNPWRRWDCYESLRRFIPYAPQLEQEKYFGGWVKTCITADNYIPPMQVDKRSLMDDTKAYHIAEKVMECLEIEGDMAELGVYMGGSLKLIAECAPNKTVHGFDTFWGIPYQDSNSAHYMGEFACGVEEVQKYVNKPNVSLHAGTFPETTLGLEDTKYSFVHIDADVYRSTIDAIRYFWPRMNSGGWMIFDDYRWDKCPGVDKAIYDVFSEDQIEVSPESANQCMIRKP